jgi:3-methylfumaryl-CoA hydratase
MDRPATALQLGSTVPAHWYAMLFAPTEPQSELEADGHPRKGNFLPPVPLPRRMFAGRRAVFHRPLRIGEPVTRVSRIASIVPKTGRSGDMCFVTVVHDISDAGGLLVTEEQDIVYRGAAAAAVPAAARAIEPAPTADFSTEFIPEPTHLFRYSAITFNAHRIHYDEAYATGVEGYPGLVVNGGLTTLRLWEFMTERSGLRLRSSSSRNLKALFVNRPVTLCGCIESGSGRAQAWALDADGDVAVRIDLELESQ